MQFHTHPNAEADLDRLFETDEDGVAYIDVALEVLSENDGLLYSLFKERYYREYDPPIGVLGIEIKKVACLWSEGIRVLRIRLDNEDALKYRIIYCTKAEKQPDSTIVQQIHILAVVHKDKDNFDYQPTHPIMNRIKNDYSQI